VNDYKAWWARYVVWFGARQQRERVIVALAVLGGVLVLGYSYAIEPALLASRAAARAAAEATAAANQMGAAAAVVQKQNADPDAAVRAELARVKVQLSEQSRKFAAVDRSLVPPDKVPALLESLLARSRSLQLVSLRTLAPVPVVDRKAVSGPGPTPSPPVPPGMPSLFKHGVEIRIAGGYSDLLAYLAELENAPQRLIWGRMELAVAEHPRAILTLTVYTLSLEKSWLVL
jgi:MSHA biogenesis protein MshJ